MIITFDINKTEDGHSLKMNCEKCPEDPKETMYLKRAVADSLNSEISTWDNYSKKSTEESYTLYPSSYKVGGQKVEVKKVERCDGNTLGECCVSAGYVLIADFLNKDDKQSESSKKNTFYHELTHSILATMGEEELNKNEKFVCAFSSFLNEAMRKAVFLKESEV